MKHWSISKDHPSDIHFESDGDTIISTFNVSTPEADAEHMRVNFLEYGSCNTTIYEDFFTLDIGPASASVDGFSDLNVTISVNRETIGTSGAWEWMTDSLASLAFCTRVDLVTDMSFGEIKGLRGPLHSVLLTSVSHIKVLYNITVDMSVGFSPVVASVDGKHPTSE